MYIVKFYLFAWQSLIANPITEATHSYFTVILQLEFAHGSGMVELASYNND